MIHNQLLRLLSADDEDTWHAALAISRVRYPTQGGDPQVQDATDIDQSHTTASQSRDQSRFASTPLVRSTQQQEVSKIELRGITGLLSRTTKPLRSDSNRKTRDKLETLLQALSSTHTCVRICVLHARVTHLWSVHWVGITSRQKSPKGTKACQQISNIQQQSGSWAPPLLLESLGMVASRASPGF